MNSPKPVVVFVHGAWHTPDNYRDFLESLRTAGFEVHCPLLPTSNASQPSQRRFEDDVDKVHELVESLVASSKHVLVVMHSYGGTVGSNALKDLSFNYRSEHGLPGGVVHLIYMCAYILPVGYSIFDIVEEAGLLQLWDKFVEDFDDGTTFPRDPVALLFQDVSPEKTEKNLRFLVRFPMQALKTKMTHAAWLNIPFTYLITTDDRAVPTIYQDIMIDKAKAQGREFEEERYDSGHSIFLTKEKEVVESMKRASEKGI